MLNLVIFGSPGAGKGTQAKLIAKKYHLQHLSSGEILRQHRDHGLLGKKISTYQDKGRLVPNNLIIKIIESAINQLPIKQGLIFDGYPRNLTQAKSLASVLKKRKQEVNLVINLQLNERESTNRILLRGQNSGRHDDNLKTLKARFKIYQDESCPLIDYYHSQNKIKNIDGRPSINEVFAQITHVLDKIVLTSNLKSQKK